METTLEFLRNGTAPSAEEGVKRIGELYCIEAELRGLDPRFVSTETGAFSATGQRHARLVCFIIALATGDDGCNDVASAAFVWHLVCMAKLRTT